MQAVNIAYNTQRTLHYTHEGDHYNKHINLLPSISSICLLCTPFQ